MVCVGMRVFLRVDDNRLDDAGITARISGNQAQIMVWTWPWRVERASLGRVHCTGTGRAGREGTGSPRRGPGPGLGLRAPVCHRVTLIPRGLSGPSFLLRTDRRSRVTSDVTARLLIQGPLDLYSPDFHQGILKHSKWKFKVPSPSVSHPPLT